MGFRRAGPPVVAQSTGDPEDAPNARAVPPSGKAPRSAGADAERARLVLDAAPAGGPADQHPDLGQCPRRRLRPFGGRDEGPGGRLSARPLRQPGQRARRAGARPKPARDGAGDRRLRAVAGGRGGGDAAGGRTRLPCHPLHRGRPPCPNPAGGAVRRRVHLFGAPPGRKAGGGARRHARQPQAGRVHPPARVRRAQPVPVDRPPGRPDQRVPGQPAGPPAANAGRPQAAGAMSEPRADAGQRRDAGGPVRRDQGGAGAVFRRGGGAAVRRHAAAHGPGRHRAELQRGRPGGCRPAGAVLRHGG